MQGSQQDGHQRRLPVVAVNHVRQPHALHHLDRHARKFREALGVVDIVAVLVAVELRAVEIRRIVDQEVSDAVHRRRLADRGKPHLVAQRRGDAGHQHGRHFIAVIPRKNDGDFMPQRLQRPWQPFHHVRKSAGLRVREAFRGYE